MTHIIGIHNANNEKAWQEVLMWEAMHFRYRKRKKQYLKRLFYKIIIIINFFILK